MAYISYNKSLYFKNCWHNAYAQILRSATRLTVNFYKEAHPRMCVYLHVVIQYCNIDYNYHKIAIGIS